VPGARWTETYIKNGKPGSSQWEVRGVGVRTTVPAGTFDCLEIRQTKEGKNKDYWFARGVGKIRERSEMSLEELTEYRVQ
jgi:hypothetical protein